MKLNKISAVLFACSLFALAACNKDQNKQDTIQFTGISPITLTGDPLGPADPTDWQLHDQWTDREHALLGDPLPQMQGDPVYRIIGIPNPCISTHIIYQVSRTSETEFRYCIVDRHYKVLLQGRDTADMTRINTEALGILDTVRIYYRIVRNDSACYGHGDIAIVKL